MKGTITSINNEIKLNIIKQITDESFTQINWGQLNEKRKISIKLKAIKALLLENDEKDILNKMKEI